MILATFLWILGVPWKALHAFSAGPITSRPGQICPRSSRGWSYSRPRAVFRTVFNIDKHIPATFLADFDDTSCATVICNNSVNIHICNDPSMFDNLSTEYLSKVVATIGGKANIPVRVGTVTWAWHDDKHICHNHVIKNVHYFPSSPVNILSVTALADQLEDKMTTGIDTKWKHSLLYWKGGHKCTIFHPARQLPDVALEIQDKQAFHSYLEHCRPLVNDMVHFTQSSCYSVSDVVHVIEPDGGLPKLEVSPFIVGERLLYSKEGPHFFAWY